MRKQIDPPRLVTGWCGVLGLIPLLLLPHSAVAASVRMAVMGDSIRAGSGVSGGSPNWVAQLTTTFPGAISFQNKAVGGATSTTVVSGQLSSVVTLATNHQIDDSALIIGGNDAASTAGLAIAEGGSPTAFINTYVTNVETVINSVAAAGPTVSQVFGNMPDVTVTPEVQQVAASAGIDAAGLQLLSMLSVRQMHRRMPTLSHTMCLSSTSIPLANKSAAPFRSHSPGTLLQQHLPQTISTQRLSFRACLRIWWTWLSIRRFIKRCPS